MSTSASIPASAARAEPFEHPALFYRSATEYLATTMPFVRDGLAAGEPVAAAVPGHNLELLRGELGSNADQVRLLDMTVVGRNPGRIIPGVLRAFADAHGDQRVRIIGEPVWPGRSGVEYPACAQHEALINSAFRGRAVTILCPYDAAQLSPSVLADVEATHPVLIDSAGRRGSSAYAPDRIVAIYNQPLPEPAAPTRVLEASAASDLATARQLARDEAARAGLPAARIDDVALVVTELLANSIEHGGGSGVARFWTDIGHFVCEVRDRGTITDPLVGRRPARIAQSGGRGLLIVNNLADLVRLHTDIDGTTLRAHFRT